MPKSFTQFAYELGQQAYRLGKSAKSPYKLGSDSDNAWHRGYGTQIKREPFDLFDQGDVSDDSEPTWTS